jgi:hypothetical protein
MNVRLEWISTHQCTNCGWARWGRFLDGRKSHPPCPIFFFFSTSSLPQNFTPSYLPPTSPRPTYHLPPPSYLPPTNPTPPHSIARAPETSGGCGAGAAGAGAGAVELERLERELERLERELELWLWSWSDWSAHEKVRTLLHFLACLLALLQRCFAATHQAAEPSSGALLQCCFAASSEGRLRSFAARCVAASSGARLRSFVARCVAASSGALLRLALLRLWSFAACCFTVAPELCCTLLCCN